MLEEERNFWANAIEQIKGMQDDIKEDYEEWESRKEF